MKIYLLLVVMLFSSALFAQKVSRKVIQIIPEPQKMTISGGSFGLTRQTPIVYDGSDSIKPVAENLAQLISEVIGAKCFPTNHIASTIPHIALKIEKGAFSSSEAYTLRIRKSGILIKAASAQGLFYGVQTLRQLIPDSIETPRNEGLKIPLPCVSIEDAPRFQYRGLHLDVSRHFFDKSFILKYIDLMSMYKYNTFHWHLTDDQGWRIEVKKYPKLTKVSSRRVGCSGDTISGFYTQDDIREVVAYASERFVEVIPEIEMPGHATAALASFSQLSCSGGPFKVETNWGVFNDVFCAGNDQTFDFLTDVLDEIIPLFPGRYIHIGGDECPKLRWQRCARCQTRMKAEGLKNEHELQGYFMRRIEKHLLEKGKKMLGWEEILEGGVSATATVMSWTSMKGGVKAATMGNDVVMCPQKECYFDHYQGVESEEPEAFGHGYFLPLKSVYNFNPMPKDLTPVQAKHILGGQANVWTEHIPSTHQVEYMVFPRALAMIECLWSMPENKNFETFEQKVTTHTARLRKMGVTVSDSWLRSSTKTKWESFK